MFETEEYTDILKSALEERMAANSSYSLRAFARDIGVQASNLSNIFNGKKGLSESKALEICEKLGLSDKESCHFCDLVNLRHAKSNLKRNMAKTRLQEYYTQDQVKIVKEDVFKVIADWYHYAILELITVADFQSDAKWIAKKLGITSFQASEAVSRLERLELIEIVDGIISSTGIQLETTSGIASKSIKKLNKQLIEKAQIAVTNQNVDERHISTLTAAISSDDVKEYGALIEKFKSEINYLANKKNQNKKPDNVYCLAMQFFNLSK